MFDNTVMGGQRISFELIRLFCRSRGRLVYSRLGWPRPSWAGLALAWLRSTELALAAFNWARLGSAGLGWAGLGSAELAPASFDCPERSWAGLA